MRKGGGTGGTGVLQIEVAGGVVVEEVEQGDRRPWRPRVRVSHSLVMASRWCCGVRG